MTSSTDSPAETYIWVTALDGAVRRVCVAPETRRAWRDCPPDPRPWQEWGMSGPVFGCVHEPVIPEHLKEKP